MAKLTIQQPDIDLSKFKDKSVLITGASGLVGINLLAALKTVQKEYNINIWTWTTKKSEIFDDIFQDCHQIVGDITKQQNNFGFFYPNFDFIIHACGYGQPIKFLSDKIKTIEINTSVTSKLFVMLKEGGTFLFISSSEVYNGLFKYNIGEHEIGITNTEHPRAAYIEGKKCGEVICNTYREMGYNVKVARLSITYGAGTQPNDTRVINSLIDKGLNNDKIELLDDGSSLRTLCYISDVTEMLFNIMLNGKDFIYNVGGTDVISILNIAKKIGSILDKEVITPSESNGLAGNPSLVNLSIEKYLNEFGQKDFYPLDAGIMNTINWQKQLNNERNKINK